MTLSLLCALPLATLAGAASWAPEHRWRAPGLAEPSGLVSSRVHDSVFWTLNDSDGEAELFAFHRDGYHISTVKIRGARNHDWESLTADDSGHLLVADVGNNDNDRRNLVIYVVDEPDPFKQDEARVRARIPFSYRDQKRFPPKTDLRFDAEASFFADGRLHLLTKNRAAPRTWLYRFDELEDNDRQKLLPRESTMTPSMVTGADLHRDGRRLAVLTYDAVIVCERKGPKATFFSGATIRTRIEVGQAEGIAWDGEDLLILNEQKELHRLARSTWIQGIRYVPEPPDPFGIARALPTGEPITPVPLLWSRPGVVSPPAAPPEGVPLAGAELGWTERGLVLDLHWPTKPRLVRGNPIAVVMASAAARIEGPSTPAHPSWYLTWVGKKSPPGVEPTDGASNKVLPRVIEVDDPTFGWSTRLEIPAEALPGWQGVAGRSIPFNLILLGPEPAGQWCHSVDATSWCWTTPDLWGVAVLEERDP